MKTQNHLIKSKTSNRNYYPPFPPEAGLRVTVRLSSNPILVGQDEEMTEMLKQVQHDVQWILTTFIKNVPLNLFQGLYLNLSLVA